VDPNYLTQGRVAAELLDRLMDGDPAPAEPVLVAEALRYIAANLHKPVSVPEVVAAVCVSRSTLERSFQSHLALPISKEIMRLRLERVKRHLIERKTNLKHVALENGFPDATTLCRIFRREIGITPGQFRKQALGTKA
jgi:AraC-like DNA-binding protein